MSFVSKKELETNLWELEIAVPAEDFSKATSQAYIKQRGRINVPGFRKGKAPRPIIEKLYGKEIFYEDALDSLLSNLLKDAYAESELDVIAQPFDLDANTDAAPENVTVTVKVWTKPVVTIAKYEGLEAEKEEVSVEDTDADAEIERRRERNARVISSENAAVEGDIAVIDFEGFLEGIPFEGGSAEKHELTLGAGQFIPGFEEQIIGHGAGEHIDVNVSFPEEYHAEELAGKPVVFKVFIHELKHKELPELDDEFAKDLGDYDTLAQLRDGVRAELLEQRQNHADEHFESNVLEALIDAVEGEIPPPMVEQQAKEQVKSMAENLQRQNLQLEVYLQYIGQTPEEFEQSQYPAAERRVRLELALEKIVELEAFEVTAEELEAEYAKIAEQYGIDAERVQKIIPEEDLKSSLKREKAINLVKDSAVAVPVKAHTEDEENGEDAE
ncbi:MAG: trigger factor [Oscillospiraceae bacterium]|jgi:trigger factor|nr:trigger factor [Oscillospiraceae bacterium]